MTDITTNTNPLLEQIHTLTIAEVMDRVSTDMNEMAQRDTLSALRSLVKFAELEAATTRADAAMLRTAFEHLNEDRLGLTAKRLPTSGPSQNLPLSVSAPHVVGQEQMQSVRRNGRI